MHWHSIPIQSRHWRSILRVTESYRRHGRYVWIGIALGNLTHVHHPLHFFLPFLLEFVEFFLGKYVLLILIQCFPTLIFVVFIFLGFRQKFFITDHAILVLVRFFEHVLSHPLHFFLPLPHVILRSVGIISLVQFLFE